MSIINDALEKAQRKRILTDQKATEAPTVPIQPAGFVRRKRRPFAYTGILVLVLAGGGSFWVLPHLLQKSVNTVSPIPSPAATSGISSVEPERPPGTPKATPPDREQPSAPRTAPLELDGILYDGNNPAQSYAVVDGSILRVGDSYQNTLVTEITENSVTVRTETGLKTLRMK